ncbi:MAG: GNAT family N-acetyltransferase [Candidatus Thiodiazotropha sp.]
MQIAFGGAKIVDGGQTGVGRGARVDPEYAGLRLARQLMNHCADWAKTKGVIRSAATEIQHGGIERVHKNYDLILSKVSVPSLCSSLRKTNISFYFSSTQAGGKLRYH